MSGTEDDSEIWALAWPTLSSRLRAAGWTPACNAGLESPVAGIVVFPNHEGWRSLMKSVHQRIDTMRYHRTIAQWNPGSEDCLSDFEVLSSSLHAAMYKPE